VNINNYFAQGALESIAFADDTVWDAAAVQGQITIAPATAGSDLIFLGEGDDVVDGLAGDDAIFGNGGNDILSGSEGSDGLQGGAGGNLLMGGAGDDASDIGQDTGHDLFIGGPGNDFIFDFSGDNNNVVYAFNAGDGQDRIFTTTGRLMTISVGGAGVNDIRLFNQDFDFKLEIGANDSIDINGFEGDPQYWPQAILQLIGRTFAPTI